VRRPYYVIDAFAFEPFTGNPAAVVLDAEGLDDRQMQSIAAEFNLSETTFVLPVVEGSAPRDAVRFRWFTPAIEVDMCGHATIAGLCALREAGRIPQPAIGQSVVVPIQTRAGLLTGFIEGGPSGSPSPMIWLELAKPALGPVHLPIPDLAASLGIAPRDLDPELPPAATQDRDILLFARDFQVINAARPDFRGLAELLNRHGWRGLSLATIRTLTPSLHVQSRFFAPSAGIDEDPVTGSVHGPLAYYLAQRGLAPRDGNIAALSCGQGKPGGRSGLLHALVITQTDGSTAVRIGGQALPVMSGELLS
jgi:PhzF family phenazine biosynthesis protein